jgi:N utilization substance protein B
MGMRRQAREWALQFLFQRDVHGEDIEAELVDFWEHRRPAPRAQSFAEELIHGVETRRGELDDLIGRAAEHWDVKRMGGVDRNVMRIAVFELLTYEDIPPIVSIDEAVEIAKRYSSYESGRFVNGILDKIWSGLQKQGVRKLEPPRERTS